MPIMPWNDTLDVGVETMNDEHRAQLGWMNKLYDRHAAGAAKPELVMLAQQLENTTRKHFRSEEQYMAAIGFPGLRNHKAIHETLLKSLAGHVAAISAGNGRIPADFFIFLKVWLTAHIQGIDTKYGAHAKERAPVLRAA